MPFTKFLTTIALPATSLLLSGATAVAIPHEGHVEGRQCTGCAPTFPPVLKCPHVESTEKFLGDTWTVGHSVHGGGTISVQTSYAVGSSWSLGGDLGLGLGDLLGIEAVASFGVTQSFEESTGVSSEYECPEDAKNPCSINVQIGMARIKGYVKQKQGDESCEGGSHELKEGPFEAVMPRKDESENPVLEPVLCQCCKDGKVLQPGPEVCCAEACAGGD